MADDKRKAGPENFGSLLREAAKTAIKDDDPNVSYVREALKWQYNLIGLAGAAAFAVVSGTGLPLLLAAGLEMIYLSIVPQSSRFRRLVRSWQYAEEKRKRNLKLSEMFHELPPEMRSRYADLDRLCLAIRENYSRLSSASQIFVGQMQERLDGLLHAYLRFLHSAFQHRQYLRAIDPPAIRREVSELQRSLESEAPKVQEINRKRIEILNKRLEKFKKITENTQVIDAQCAAIEDVLQLIRDQSVTLRDPQQVSDQLESLMHDVEETEDTVKQVEAVFELAAPDMPLSPLPSATEASSTTPSRDRMRN
jgi:hypothetical protein